MTAPRVQVSKGFLQGIHTLRWFTTPEELREIADRMEERWAHLSAGESKVLFDVGGSVAGADYRLQVCIDQQGMAETRGRYGRAEKGRPDGCGEG